MRVSILGAVVPRPVAQQGPLSLSGSLCTVTLMVWAGEVLRGGAWSVAPMTGWVFLVALANFFPSFFCVWAYDVSVRCLFFEVRVSTEKRNEMIFPC